MGCHCYLGSEIRVAPGAELPKFCIVALGSVLAGQFWPPRSLIGGNPASVARELQERDLILIVHKTRDDIPDELGRCTCPKTCSRPPVSPTASCTLARCERP